MQIVDDVLLAALREVVKSEAPREAVGLLTADRRIIMLPNRASDPGKNFAVHKEDILSALRREEIEDVADLTLWHSHPNGGVGPSRVDIQQRLPFFNHLVVTLVPDDIVLTWY